MQAIQLIRSVLFIFLMYLAMAIMGVIYGIATVFKRDMAYTAVYHYCHVVRFLAHYVVGLRSEIRGTVPEGELIIASKHQGFLTSS